MGSTYKRVKRSKNAFVRFFVILLIIAAGVGVSFALSHLVSVTEKTPRVSALYELWETGDYEAVYSAASQILEVHPLQNTALAFKGYSAYYLSLAQNDTQMTDMYLDDAIISLRNALYDAQSAVQDQIRYMLGKSYYQKNRFAGYHYYADLAVRYLDEAFNGGYAALDLAEYRGLAYASLGMTDESIAAFTEALLVNSTDMLLAAIGEQYYRQGNYIQAQQYLFRALQASEDELLVLKCRSTLGSIYIIEDNLAEAEKEFNAILERDPNYADAYYNLGVIYEKQGDLVKARAEWRKALKIQVNHPESRKKLNS
ncbi:MAG: tetratricopeptide repeat protein [Spirochaetaceae bacterium]|nr:tetratricopeptide repeat protein [Spirochaetaceae bacterium]